MARTTGIRARHARTCRAEKGGRCNCDPSYEAWVWSPRDKKKIRKTLASEAAARLWRSDASGAVARGGMRAPTPTTVRDAGTALIAGMKDGTIRKKGGKRYKPSLIRGYERSLEQWIYPEFGPVKLANVKSIDVQGLVDRLVAAGMDPSTLRSILNPLRTIYRRACRPGGEVLINPTRGLELPAVRGKRDRIASPEEAAKLIGLLPRLFDRVWWAVAFYAGLRLGELFALRWRDVDLAEGVIHVRASWDSTAKQFTEPKSDAGTRKVPIVALLRDFLVTWKLKTGGHPDALVFGRTADEPYSSTAWRNRARRAWAAVDACNCHGVTRAGKPCQVRLTGGRRYCPKHIDQAPAGEEKAKPTVERIELNEARHTFASLMIAAGVNAKALSVFIGHSEISTTFDLYGHLMPGGEAEAAALLDAYLERANTQARLAQIETPSEAVLEVLPSGESVAEPGDCAPVVRQSYTENGGSQPITADRREALDDGGNGLAEPETA